MVTKINQILQKEKHDATTNKIYENMNVLHYIVTSFIPLLVVTVKKRNNIEGTDPNHCKFQKPKALMRILRTHCHIQILPTLS